MNLPAIHFVGFRDDRYWSAVKVWGLPHYIHRGWDRRAQRDVDTDVDTVVFADGAHDQPPRARSFDDLTEAEG